MRRINLLLKVIAVPVFGIPISFLVMFLFPLGVGKSIFDFIKVFSGERHFSEFLESSFYTFGGGAAAVGFWWWVICDLGKLSLRKQLFLGISIAIGGLICLQSAWFDGRLFLEQSPRNEVQAGFFQQQKMMCIYFVVAGFTALLIATQIFYMARVTSGGRCVTRARVEG